MDDVAEELNSGALEFVVVSTPELGDAGLGLVGVTRLASTELLDPALSLGSEAVLLLVLQRLPQALLW